MYGIYGYYTTTILQPFFQDHPGEPVPEEYFWTLRCKRRLTEAYILTISVRTKQCPSPPSPHFLQAGCPSCHPTNNVKALKAKLSTNKIRKYS